jgi:hypothetical protein
MHKNPLLLFAVILAMCASSSAGDTAHIVKRFHLYNQTGPIGPVVVYTPKHGGMFRVNTFVVTTVGNGETGAGICERLSFTNKFGSSQVSPTNAGYCAGAAQAGDTIEGTIPIADEGGKQITFSVFASEDISGAKYNVTIIVEEL